MCILCVFSLYHINDVKLSVCVWVACYECMHVLRLYSLSKIAETHFVGLAWIVCFAGIAENMLMFGFLLVVVVVFV